MSKNTIGQFIATLRKANGMTQQDVAERLNVSNKAVSRWERDECAPDLSAIPALAEMFGITCDELLRGERNNPDMDAPEETIHKLKLKSDKQFRLMLYNRKKQFTNLTFISIGLIIVGLIVAMICNLGFSRGLLGFCLTSVFLVAATICQICFTVSFRMLIDEDGTEHAEEIERANTAMVFGTVKIFFAILMMFAFCLPIGVMTLSYYDGLVIDSWLLLGAWFAIVAFIVAFVVYKLFILNVLVRKKFVYMTASENEKMVLNRGLLKKCCSVFIIIFSVLIVGSISVSIADEIGFFTDSMFDTFTSLLLIGHVLNLLGCTAWYCIGTLRRKRTIK